MPTPISKGLRLISSLNSTAEMRGTTGPGLDTDPPDLREHFTKETARNRANRRNAQKSTGPKTEKGKAASSQNRLAHGLCSE